MKHRLISLITALALCLSLCPPWALAAEASPGWTYDTTTGTLTIESDEGCVNWCTTSDVDKANIQTVTISDGVTSIGVNAFKDCTLLTSVEIPDGVESIGNGAFEDCSSLTSIKIPSSVTSIEDRTFFNCTRLTQVEIPNSVTSIKDSAFSGCSSLTSVEIPSSVTSIGVGVFVRCTGLKTLIYPGALKIVGVPTSTAQLAYTDDGNGGVIVEIVSEGQQADGNFIPENIGGKPVTSIKNCKQHTGGTATCVQKAVCSICREAYGDLAPHTFDNDGSCSVCQKQAGVKVENSDGTITYYGTINDVVWSEDPITLLADGVLPAHIGDYKLNLTVEQGVKLTIPAGHGLTAASLTNNGTIVNEGTIELENAGSDDIKNLNLTGSGTVRVADKVYENNGSELIGDLDFSSKDRIPTGDGYSWASDTKTLTLSNVKIGGKVTLPDNTVTVKTEGQCSIGELTTPPGYSGDPNPEKTKLTFTGPGTLTVQQGINLSGGDDNAITVDAGATVIANGRIVIGASGAVNSVVTVNGTLTVESTNNTALSAGMVTVGPSGKLSVSDSIGVTVNGMPKNTSAPHNGLFTIEQGGSFQATYTDHGLLHQDTSTLSDDLNAGDVFVIPSGYLPLDCEVQKSGDSIKLVKLGTSDPYPSPLTIHNHGWSWSYDASQHWQVCTNPTKCGSTYNQAPHSGSPCSVCGYSRPIDPPRPTYYRVTYASGGGQGTPPSGTQKTAGSRFRLAENSFTLAGWEFSGWEYDGKVYQPGELFTMPRRSVTFTAQWTELPPETYAVTFDPNGGSGSMDPGTATENVAFVLPACAYAAPKNHEFDTWAIGAPDGPKVPPDGEFVFTENTTVYALWKEIPQPPTPPTPPAASSPSGGGGSVVRYRITVEDAEYGAVEANCDSAASGTVIKLTAAADAGYALSELTVEDSRGQKIPVTDRLTFVMPNRDVTVAASFAPVPAQPCSGGYGCPSRPYQDLEPKAWYHAAVDAAIQRGLLAGFEDGTFRPGGLLTRGQLAQILYNQAGRPPMDGGGSFSDVPSGVWYASAVRWMAAQGIAGGYGDGRFGPDDSITREQLAVMLWRYFGSPAATAQTLQFSDAAQASGWAVDALLWASEKGVLKGKGGNVLDPKGLTTRAEAAQMLYPLS